MCPENFTTVLPSRQINHTNHYNMMKLDINTLQHTINLNCLKNPLITTETRLPEEIEIVSRLKKTEKHTF